MKPEDSGAGTVASNEGQVGFKLPLEVIETIDALAAGQDRSRSSMMRLLIKTALEERASE